MICHADMGSSGDTQNGRNHGVGRRCLMGPARPTQSILPRPVVWSARLWPSSRKEKKMRVIILRFSIVRKAGESMKNTSLSPGVDLIRW